MSENDTFMLHWPDDKRANILKPQQQEEIIVLYQKFRSVRYLTHLVVAIDEKRGKDEKRTKHKFGRYVKVLAFTGTVNAIRFDKTKLNALNFTNRGWGTAERLIDIANSNEIEEYQIELWRLFRPYFKNNMHKNDRYYTRIDQETEEEAEDDVSSEEGRLKLVNHYIRERNQYVVEQKKKQAIKDRQFFCEVCGFSFIHTYNQYYIECHHTTPVSEGKRETKPEDLALVCSNCHRMLHRKIGGRFLSTSELRNLIQKRE